LGGHQAVIDYLVSIGVPLIERLGQARGCGRGRSLVALRLHLNVAASDREGDDQQ